MNNEDHRWLTVSEAAERARCGRRAIYNAAKAGQLRAGRMGGRLRFRPEAVDGWLEGFAPSERQAPVSDETRAALA